MFIKTEKGFSLIELMIGLFIASMVSISIFYLFDRGQKDFTQLSNTSELQTEADAIFTILERDLSRGGFVHPIRGDISNAANCKSNISSANAVKIVSSTEVSACFDKPSYDGSVAYRYKVTYKLGDGTSDLPNTNTLYKKTERTDNCTSTITSGDPNYASTIHGWQPVSKNINTIAFAHPTIGSSNSNLLDVDINFESQNQSTLNLDFRKRIHLKNKSLIASSTQCDQKCPNSKDLFANYNISSNETHWDPDTQNVPSATVVISENYVEDEDKIQWDASLASTLGLTVEFQDSTGIFKVTGTTTARNYEKFLRTVNYVNLENDPDDRTTHDGDDREFILSLGFGSLCEDLIGRVVGSVRHFYCYVEDTTSGKGAYNKYNSSARYDNNNLWWGEAKLRAESQTYYNLDGYLASITSDAENEYVLDKIRDEDGDPIAAWFGGTDNPGEDDAIPNADENNWVWSGGPEKGQVFYTHNGNSSDDGFVDWRQNEPNNCCCPFHEGGWNEKYNSTVAGGLDTDEHFPDACGEHYTQFSDQISGSGYWNDLFLPGVTWSPFNTKGYVLEFSTNFPSPTIACGGGSAAARAACANYFGSFDLVLDDTSYTDPDMLDLCDPNPSDSSPP